MAITEYGKLASRVRGERNLQNSGAGGGHRTGWGHDRTKAWRALTCDGISKVRVVGQISRGGESWMSPRQMGFRGKLNPNRGGEWRSLPGRVEFREGTPRWTNS